MNSSSFDQILRQVFIVPILAVLLGAGVLAWQLNQAHLTVDHIESSDQTISRTEQLSAMILDQETGLRGYQTTGDPQFLDPYNKAIAAIPIQIEQLRATDNNPRFLAAMLRFR